MAEEDVRADDTAKDSQPELTEQTEDVKTVDEPVDEMGVPLKNREAEAKRKAYKAQQELMNPAEPSDTDIEKDEAVKIVEDIANRIADEKMTKRLEPVLVKQFLLDNPDAANYVEDINNIRAQYPELGGVDKLELAFKIAKSNKEEERVMEQAKVRAKQTLEKQEKGKQASVEGSGSSKTVPSSVAEKIMGAKTFEDLESMKELIRK